MSEAAKPFGRGSCGRFARNPKAPRSLTGRPLNIFFD
jgi:hypothetical protein